MAPKMKRPAAAAGAAAKKGRVGPHPEVVSKCGAIADAVKQHEATPSSIRAILSHAVKHTLSVHKEERHDFDHVVVEQIGTVLTSMESSMEANIATHQATVDGADACKATRAGAVSEATEALEKLKAATIAAKGPMDTDVQAVKDLTAAVAALKKSTKKDDAEITKLEQKKEAMDKTLKQTLLPLKITNGTPAVIRGFEKACKLHGLDPSMLQSALPVLKKAVPERTSFDLMVITQMEEAYASKIEGVNKEIEAATPAKAERHAAIEAKEAELAAAVTKADASKEAYNSACTAEKEGAKVLKASEKAVSNFMPDMKKAGDGLDKAKADRVQFEWGPKKYFAELKELAPPPAAAETEPLPEDTSGLEKVSVVRHVYNARGGAPPYRGSYLTATDTIEMLKDYSLKAQVKTLLPPDGHPVAPMFSDATVMVTPSLPEAPKKWEGAEADSATKADMTKTAGEVFGTGANAVILIPMRGMD